MKKTESTCGVNENGNKIWYLNGKYHREDGPAVEYANGDKEWWLNGKRHRVGGPAVEYANGTKAWYINDNRHREDGPAIEYANGDKLWYLNGKYIINDPLVFLLKLYEYRLTSSLIPV